MGLHRAVILVATALVFVVNIAQANVCNGRSMVVQVRVPNHTNITIQYPNQENPVTFVPYPYQQPGSSNAPDCYTCRGPKCQRCNADFNSHQKRPATYTKTNIIIDLTKDKPDKPQKGKDDHPVKDGKVIILQDDNTASSISGSSAKGGKHLSVSSSASTSIANTDIIASLNEEKKKGKQVPDHTEDIYVLDASKSASASLSTASAGEKPKDQPPPANPPNPPNPPKQPTSDQHPPPPHHPSPPNQGSPSKDNPPPDDKAKPSQPSPDDGDKEHKIKKEIDVSEKAKVTSTN